ncbi:MAG: alpha/beta fold hydrolase [Gemmataceae bacterium]
MKPGRFGWVRRHPWRTLALAVLASAVLVNAVACRQARAMLAFSADGARTPRPEELTAWGKAKALALGVTVPRPALGRTPGDIGLSAESVRFAADDGMNLEAWLVAPPAAKGTAILFHGYAACRSALLPEAAAVVELGYAALVVDFRGGGGSDGSDCTLGYDEARDVVAALRFARERNLPGPVVLFGQSMGGAAVLRAVGVLGADPDGIIVEAVFARTLTTVRNRFALMGVPAFPGAELLVFWGGVRGGFDAFTHDPAEYARSCRVPALVLHGGADRNATPDEGRAIFDNLAGRKELVVFDGVGHTSLCGADRLRWAACVGQYVESVVGR